MKGSETKQEEEEEEEEGLLQRKEHTLRCWRKKVRKVVATGYTVKHFLMWLFLRGAVWHYVYLPWS